MLIPFDNILYTPMTEEEARPTVVIWINPTEVASVHGLKPDKFGTDRANITLRGRDEGEDGGNHEWIVSGHSDYIAKIINTAILGPVQHVQSTGGTHVQTS